jgi:hypothetical protein
MEQVSLNQDITLAFATLRLFLSVWLQYFTCYCAINRGYPIRLADNILALASMKTLPTLKFLALSSTLFRSLPS